MVETTSDSMNDLLRTFYEAALLELDKHWQPLPGDSRPMLLAVPAAYSQTPVKLMVVGQEAGGWAESVDMGPGAAARLMRFYEDFDFGRHQRSTPFWQAARYISAALNPTGPAEGFLWSNLVKVDVQRQRPLAVLEEALAALRLLERELELTAPDAVIFFTGPRYDERLKATFPHVSLEDLGGGTASIKGLGCRAARTYHPRYLRQSRRWGELDKAARVLIKG